MTSQSPFLTPEDLARLLQVDVDKVAEWRRRYGWPHFKIGREVRFTEADVHAIVRQHAVASSRPGQRGLPGQTPLSAARNR